MVRQARSEVTRRKILDAAIDLFAEAGYPGTGLGDIIERAELTKGALYYHFDSKETLATAIIEEMGSQLLKAFRDVAESSAPALESVIHGGFITTQIAQTDRVGRAGSHLLRAFGGFSPAARRTYVGWQEEMEKRVRQASAEGDLRDDVDIDAVTETIVGGVLGADLLANAISGGTDVHRRLTAMWQILLPAIVADESLPYFQQFLARETLRQT